jgi:16S rRNA (uracil1498-N3)-methyltransferase
MPYFLIGQALRPGDVVELTGEEARHAAASRRLRPGESLSLQDPQGNRFRAVIEGGAAHGLRVRVLEPEPVPELPARRVTLLQAIVKPKAAELIVQKCTELGVAALEFFPSSWSTVSHRELSHPRTLPRWERIAWEACKQSGRRSPPDIRVRPGFSEALKSGQNSDRRWVLDLAGKAPGEHGARPLAESISLLVGPEGGFTPEERRQAADAGYQAVALGALTLRTETAAVAACALALYA